MAARPSRVATRVVLACLVLSLLATAASAVVLLQRSNRAGVLAARAVHLDLWRATFALDVQATVVTTVKVANDFGVGASPAPQELDLARVGLVRAVDAAGEVPREVREARDALERLGPPPLDGPLTPYVEDLYADGFGPIDAYLRRTLDEDRLVIASDGLQQLAGIGPFVFGRVALARGLQVSDPDAAAFLAGLGSAPPVPVVPGADDLTVTVGVPDVGPELSGRLVLLTEGPAAAQVREGLRWIVAAAAQPTRVPPVPPSIELPTFLQQLTQLELAVGQVIQDEVISTADLATAEAADGARATRWTLAVTVACVLPALVLTRSLLVRARARRRELELSASRDALTGLLNRTGLERHPAVTRAGAGRRSGDHGQVVLIADLDHFKAINDTHGHHAGDLVLQDFAGVLSAAVRGDDAIARWGGDEFVLVVGARSDAEADARAVGERIVAGLQRPLEIGGARLVNSASLGAAWCRCGGCGFDTLMRVADTAVYEVKRRGRGGLEVLPCPQEPPRTRLHAKAMRSSRRV